MDNKDFLNGMEAFHRKTGKGDITKPNKTRDGATIADRLKAYYTEPTYEDELTDFLEYVMNNMNPTECGGKIKKVGDVLEMEVNFNALFDDYDYKLRRKVEVYILKNAEAKLIELTGFSRIYVYDEGPYVRLVFAF